MADTTFVAYSNLTPITADWLNDVNALTYNKIGTQVNPLNVDRIEPITALVSLNNLTVTLEPTTLDFRSATLGLGLPNTRQVATSISMVVPSGATLGTTSAVAANLVLLAIDNAGTVELAIINPTTTLNESGLISTTAISITADLANIAYSTTARANVPYRVVGFITITEASIGVWATAPTTVQGAGGVATTSKTYMGSSVVDFATKTVTQGGIATPRMVQTAIVAATSGTSIAFSSIPSWVKRITMNLYGVSTNGTSNLYVRIGSGGVVTTTGYYGECASVADAVSPSELSAAIGFPLSVSTIAATARNSQVTLTCVGSNAWIISGTGSSQAGGAVAIFSGATVLAGILNIISLTTGGGTDLFDGGSVSLIYEG